MDYNLIFFLPAVIIFGIVTSYTDIRYSKIKNKHIFVALFYALIVYVFMISFFIINKTPINTKYLVEIITNCITALIIGFLMWNFGLWTAGDSKLFFAYTLLIPISIYRYGYVPYFPSLVLLVNTFVPTFIAIFLLLVTKTNTKQKINSLKNTFQPTKIMTLAVSLFGVWGLIIAIFSILGKFNKSLFILANNYSILIILLFILVITIEKTIKKPLIIFSCLSLFRLLFDKTIYNIQFVTNFFSLLLFFLIFKFFIIDLAFTFSTRNVDIKLLRPGMIPAEVVYLENRKYNKRKIVSFDIMNYFSIKNKQFLVSSSHGLTKREVDELKRLYAKKRIKFEHLLVYQQWPFAPFLFFGALATILSKGSLFAFFSSLLR